MKRQQHIDAIAEMLATLSSKVRLLNSVNLTDLNIHAEDLYCDLLNEIYGYSLKNLNIEGKNTEAIDLGDRAKRIALQVTADTSTAKLEATVNKFVDQGLSKDFDRLIVLQIGREANYRKGTIKATGGIEFDKKKDVWDNRTLLSAVKALPTRRIQVIRTLLNEAGIVRRGNRRAVFALVCAFVLLAAVSSIIFWKMSATQDSLRREVRDRQEELQSLIGKEHVLFAYVDAGADWAKAVSLEHPDVRPLADKLRNVTDLFERRFRRGELPPADARLIRLARATVANAEGRYSDADALVTIIDLEQATNDLSSMMIAKADAAFGLMRWEESLDMYTKANKLRPNIHAQMRLADSHYYLGQFDLADTLWIDIGQKLDAEFAHGDPAQGRTAAVALANRAGVLLERGKYREAHRYTLTALTVLRLLRKGAPDQRLQKELSLDIARTQARLGHIFEALGAYVVAQLHLEAALEMYQTLKFREYPPEYVAESLQDLGIVLFKQGRAEDAEPPIGAACLIYQRESERGRSELHHDWAVCLQELAKATFNEKPKESLKSVSRAIELMEPIATTARARDELAILLVLRGAVHLRVDRSEAAESDFDRANSIASEGKQLAIHEQIERAKETYGKLKP